MSCSRIEKASYLEPQAGCRNFISHKVFSKSFWENQFPQKSVDSFFILVIVKDALTDLWWSWLLQNDVGSTLYEIDINDASAPRAESHCETPCIYGHVMWIYGWKYLNIWGYKTSHQDRCRDIRLQTGQRLLITTIKIWTRSARRTWDSSLHYGRRAFSQREISFLTTYWPESISSSWWLDRPVSRHGSVNSLFQVALYLPC